MEAEPVEDRRAALRKWLMENVLVPPTPQSITISDIKFDWERGSGSFVLALDGERLMDRFNLSVEMNGKVTFGGPLFVSPMGVPATFSAVDLDRPTSQAIQKGLERIFPLYYAFGRHKHRKRLVDIWTPLHRRIVDQKDFQEKRALIDSGQCVVTEMVVKPL